MSTAKDKAEAYVRSKCPELMELSFGCRFEVTDKDNFPYSVGYIDTSGRMIMDGFHVGEFKPNEHHNVSKSWHIIGHPIQLQHWAIMIGEKSDFTSSYFKAKGIFVFRYVGGQITFTKDGQPATEEDYQAFCEIVGV